MADQSPSDEGNPAEAAQAGPFQYYQPPPSLQAGNNTQAYADQLSGSVSASPDERQAATSRIPIPSQQHGSSRLADGKGDNAPKDAVDQHPYVSTQQLANPGHVDGHAVSGSVPRSSTHNVDYDAAPPNLRSSMWSPTPDPSNTASIVHQPHPAQPLPEQQDSRKLSTSSNTTDLVRRGSVPDRSPLQYLETDSKERRRALLEEAEDKARRKSVSGRGEGEVLRSGTLRGDKERAMRDGVARQSSTTDRRNKPPRDVVDQAQAQSDRDKRNSRKAGKQAIRETPNPDLSGPGATAAAGNISHARDSTSQRNSSNSSYTKAPRYQVPESETQDSDWSTAAERGKAIHERRRSEKTQALPHSPVSPVSPQTATSGRASGRHGNFSNAQETSTQNHISAASAGSEKSTNYRSSGNSVFQGPDAGPAERSVVQDPSHPQHGRKHDRHASVKYNAPPQIGTAQRAREQVGFVTEDLPTQLSSTTNHSRFHALVHRQDPSNRSYRPTSKLLDDWKTSGTARLSRRDLDFEQTLKAASAAAAAAAASDLASQNEDKSAAWWEKRQSSESPQASKKVPDLSRYSGPYEEKAFGFQPRLFLKCGPLLRFTGVQSTRPDQEVWRGSIMIVTQDEHSELTTEPILRLFAQPMDLLPPPDKRPPQAGQELAVEQEDPVAGQVKLSRTGRALYVRPVHEIDRNIDLSRLENPKGLFSPVYTPLLGPQSITQPDGRTSKHITFQNRSRIKNRDGEKAGRYREVKAFRLHSEHGHTFWRFNIEIELGDKQSRIAYRINKGPAIAFWVPAKGESMNVMFHSCNGFSASVNPADFSGPDPLWRDVLNRHQHRPFHVMIGGGDQIYNDRVATETQIFGAWIKTKDADHKRKAEFTLEMQEELETFYFNRYAMWFSQGFFGMANSQIPMVNIWDDHDIIDGYGSYPHSFMSTAVFTGLGAVAFKYYMLFQHQSLVTETEKDEPSWLLGKTPGPYISELSRSVFLHLGKKVAFLGLDCRTERMKDEVLSQETYDAVFARCRKEIVKGDTHHLIVLLGVPIAYPRLNFLENILTSRAMDPIKALGRTGMLGGFINKFDGGVEILDDLDDHWTAKHHKAERNWFIQELQDLAAERSVRVTILGGDVHLGAVSQFYTPKRFEVSKDKDHRYMPNVISSAIVNTPPPNMMADILNRRNKIHHLDEETDEDMIPMFTHDVDHSKRNNTHLLPRRNYCTIREFIPGHTPPSTPTFNPNFGTSTSIAGANGTIANGQERRFPPGSMKRTMSLTRGTATLVRRLSLSKNRKASGALTPDESNPFQPAPGTLQRANSMSGPHPDRSAGSYFPAVERPVNSFHRRPTNLSMKEARKAAAKGGANANDDDPVSGHINLEGGLDISLCMEVDQHDPAGTTEPYRLLVPALFYDNEKMLNNVNRFSSHRKSLIDRLRTFRKREEPIDQDAYDDFEGKHQLHDGDHSSVMTGSPITPTAPPDDLQSHPRPAGARQDSVTSPYVAANDLGLTSTGRGAQKAPVRNGGSGPAPFPGPNSGAHYATSGRPPTSSGPNPSPYPQSSYRRSSAPAPAQRPAVVAPTQPRNDYAGDGYSDDGAALTSDDDDDEINAGIHPAEFNDPPLRSTLPNNRLFPPIRRPSKSERFFGLVRNNSQTNASNGGPQYQLAGNTANNYTHNPPPAHDPRNTGLWATIPATTATATGPESAGVARGNSFSARKMSMQLDSRPAWGSLTRDGSLKKKPAWKVWK